MGATHSTLLPWMTAMGDVSAEIRDVARSLNVKSWSNVDNELEQEIAEEAILDATTTIANDTATKTSTTTVVAAGTTLDAYIVAVNAYGDAIIPLLMALRNKDWNLADSLKPAYDTAEALVFSTHNNTTTVTATQGAAQLGFGEISGNFNAFVGLVTDYVEARRDKRYHECERLLLSIDVHVTNMRDDLAQLTNVTT